MTLCLTKDLEFARSLRDLPPLERTRELFAFVGRVMTPPGGSNPLELAMAELEHEFADKTLRIGDVQEQYHAGVCRHRSLLFKILGDEAGLKTALVRGNYVRLDSGTGGGHAWNEIQLDDGRRFLVDTMRYPNSDLPEITNPDVTNADIPKRYVGVTGTHYYQSAAAATEFGADPPKLEPIPWVDGERLILNLAQDDGRDLGIEEYRAVKIQNGAAWRLGRSVGLSGENSVSNAESDSETMRPISSDWKDVRYGEAQAAYHSSAVELSHLGNKEVVEIPLDANAIDGDEMIYELRRLPLEEGYQTTIPVFAVQSSHDFSGIPIGLDVDLRVGGKEKVETPSGKWECYPVKTSTGGTYWISDDAHRYLVKSVQGRVIGSLAAISVERESSPVSFHDDQLGISLTAPPNWLICRYKNGQPANHALIRTFDPNAETAHGHLRLFATNTLSKDAQKSSKAWAESELRKTPMKVREGSWKECAVAGRPAVSFLADESEKGKALVWFFLYAVGPKQSEQFVYACAPEKFEALKKDVDGIIASYRIE